MNKLTLTALLLTVALFLYAQSDIDAQVYPITDPPTSTSGQIDVSRITWAS